MHELEFHPPHLEGWFTPQGQWWEQKYLLMESPWDIPHSMTLKYPSMTKENLPHYNVMPE